MARKILAAVDGTVHSLNAFERALELAKILDAELFMVHVIPDTRTGGQAENGTRYGSMAIGEAYYRSAEKVALEWLKPLERKAKRQQVKSK